MLEDEENGREVKVRGGGKGNGGWRYRAGTQFMAKATELDTFDLQSRKPPPTKDFVPILHRGLLL